MWRFIGGGLLVMAVALFGFSLVDGGGDDVATSAVLTMRESEDIGGYARAIEARDWQFPRDHGAHNAYQIEWWYYTGNYQTEDGRRFGVQFTIFRRALSPTNPESESEWRTNQAYMAHFSVSDLDAGEFYHEERYSRGAAGLAGALPDEVEPDAPFRVWLEDWETRALNDDASQMRITANADNFAVDLTLERVKPIALQGDNGLSPKSDEPGNASYYYSLTRLATDGTITIGDEIFAVTGLSWMDQEFSTSVLSDDSQGWDWFSMQFDDGRELVVGQIRRADGSTLTAYTGTMIYEDGTTHYLRPDEYTITATGSWESPHTGAVYPSGWIVTLDAEVTRTDADLEIIVTPLMQDQELHSGDIAYWEGATLLSGDVSGYGYTELTGYTLDDPIAGRF